MPGAGAAARAPSRPHSLNDVDDEFDDVSGGAAGSVPRNPVSAPTPPAAVSQQTVSVLAAHDAADAAAATAAADSSARLSAVSLVLLLATFLFLGLLSYSTVAMLGRPSEPSPTDLANALHQHTLVGPPGMRPEWSRPCFELWDPYERASSQIRFRVCLYRHVAQVGIDWFTGGDMFIWTGRWHGKWLTTRVDNRTLYVGQRYDEGERCNGNGDQRLTNLIFACERNATTPHLVAMQDVCGCCYQFVVATAEWCAVVDAGHGLDAYAAGGRFSRGRPVDAAARRELRAPPSDDGRGAASGGDAGGDAGGRAAGDAAGAGSGGGGG